MGVALVALGFLLSVGSIAAPVQAASLTSAQVQAVISLLQSFGVDAGTIANVQATLGGSSGSLSCSSFADVTYGSFDNNPGGRVSQLQTWLGIPSNTFGFGTYGRKTQAAWNSRCGGVQTTTSTSASGVAPLTTGTPTIGSISPSGTPAISVASVSGLSITLQYSNMPPAALKVFNNTSSAPIWTQELNGNGSTSGTTSFTLPNGTPSGQYIIEATDANGNNYAGTAWFGVTNTVAVPTISITAISTAISPAMSMAVQYNNMPAAGVRIMDASGATVVGTQSLTSGGSGSTVVSLPSILPTGNYTAQAYGSNGTIYATSAPYHFTAPDIGFVVGIGSLQSITLGMGQSASDGGIKITLASTATNSSGAAVANVNFAVTGAQPGFCSTAAGGTLCGGGGFGDPASPTNAVSITVSSVSLQNNTVTVVITTAQKG